MAKLGKKPDYYDALRVATIASTSLTGGSATSSQHSLVGGMHSASGLVIGPPAQYLKALTATTFGFAVIPAADVPDLSATYLTPGAHTAIGNGAPHHAAISLAASASVLLDLSGQALSLDTQTANYVLAGPVSGGAVAPTFRALVAADIPAAAPAAHDQNANTIIIPSGLGAPTYDDVQDFLNTTRSAGRLTGGVISKGAGATINITAMDGMIFTGNTLGTSPLIYFKMPQQTNILATGIAPNLIDNSVNWIYVDYAGGVPVYKATIDRSTIDEYTMFTVGRVWVSGATVEVLASGHSLYNKDRRSHNRLILKYGGMDHVSGAYITAHATPLRLTCDAGSWYIANTAHTTPLVDQFYVIYKTGGGAWTQSALLTLFSEVFDGVGGNKVYETYQTAAGNLVALTGNHYGVYWIFMCPLGHLNVVLGDASYANIGAAQAATIPASLPARCTNWSRLIGRVIIKKSDAAFYSVESVWVQTFTLSAATDHASLFNLAWASSAHTGTASRVAAFDGAGAAISGALIPPVTNVLTLTNTHAATLDLHIEAGKILTLLSADTFTLTVPATGIAALIVLSVSEPAAMHVGQIWVDIA